MDYNTSFQKRVFVLMHTDSTDVLLLCFVLLKCSMEDKQEHNNPVH